MYKRHRAPIIVRCTASAHPRETTSRAGNNYTTFKLEDQSGSCAVNVTQRNPRPPLCLLRNRSDFRRLDLVIERVVTLMMFSLEYTIHANVIVIG